ncbi:DUF4065 domain-containing protein [Erysipelothrix rhusiopathiae]|nr:DUF4065 domain-containing protein [Erysipelothrix rhusiopathiae]
MEDKKIYSAQEISNYIIEYSNSKGYSIKNIRLQKTLYAVQGLSLLNRDMPAFNEKIEAWKYGPVVPDIYYNYASYGPSEITKEGIMSNMIIFTSLGIQEKEYSNDLISSDMKEVIESTVDFFSKMKDFDIVDWSHAHTAWFSTYNPDNIHVEINHEKISNTFKAMFANE